MKAIERAEVRFGLTPVAYQVRRSTRQGTVSIVVSPGQGVMLQAPAGTSPARLAEVVRLKAPWILRQLRRQRGLERVGVKELVSGETFFYLGRQYRLRVVARGDNVKLKGGWLLAPKGRVRKSLVAWYRGHAEERLVERVAYWSGRLQQPVEQVLVREQAMRWGSCDARGNLRLNWRIIQAPMALIDYVVALQAGAPAASKSRRRLLARTGARPCPTTSSGGPRSGSGVQRSSGSGAAGTPPALRFARRAAGTEAGATTSAGPFP